MLSPIPLSVCMSTAPTITRLMVVEFDPVFRSGLINCFSRFADLRVVVEADTVSAAWRSLSERETRVDAIDVILIGSGLSFAQQVKSQYPELSILLIEPLPEAALLSAFQSGVEGYCPKGSSIAQFVAAIQALKAGQPYWREEVLAQLRLARTQPESISVISVVRQNWRSSGLRQIDAALSEIEAELRSHNLSVLDQLFLTGRRRELKAARWMVQQLLPAQDVRSTRSPVIPPTVEGEPLPALVSRSALDSSAIVVAEDSAEEPRPKELQAILFDQISSKLQSNLENFTGIPLEIDLLKLERKRELFFTILRQLEEVLEELRFSQVQPEQLAEKRSTILRDLWQAVVMEFFGRYSTVRVRNRDIEVVTDILEEASAVQSQILEKIPLVQEILSHLLFQTPLLIDQTPYDVGTPQARDRALDILENLTIQLANAVIQPLLNRFSNLEVIKQRFYDRRLLSTREIERFRNDLSWRFRVERYVAEPRAIFESQYRLFVLSDYGIERLNLYAPRNEELEELSGIQLAVTLALETRDAISPRLKAAIAFLGSGIVYVLTEVIGRGIGLIGRGILKGIGKSVRG